MKFFYRFLPIAFLLLWSCHSEDFSLPDDGRDFVPLQKGLYQLYTVEETIYSEVNPVQKLNYQIKVLITDSFPNADGGYTFVLQRSKRSSDSSPWQNVDTWSARSTSQELVINEENVSFVKLSFPVKRDAEWNGNRFNTLGKDDYQLISYDEMATFGGIDFDKTATVVEEDNEDFIFFLDQRKSVYARNVGLVYREVTQLSYCTDDNCRGQQKVKSGTIYKQQISEYGFQ